MSENILDIMTQLQANLPSIREQDFRRDFLPLFANTLPEDQIPMAIAAWVGGVAKSAAMPVEVIDNRTGEVLFTTPPILDTRLIMLSDDNKFADISGMYKLQHRNMPEVAMRDLNDGIEIETHNSIDVTLSDQWDAMLTYYHITPSTAVTEIVVVEDVLGDLGL